MKVSVVVESARIGIFFELLSTGVFVKTTSGVSVREFLCARLGIDPHYLDSRIQTIFLNGRALDDIDAATLTEGSVLALSGAMPGLAGAVFRRGGTYASFRSNVAATPTHFKQPTAEGIVILKLFNQVGADLGPYFLKKGIRIKGNALSEFFRYNLGKFEHILTVIEVDGKKYPFQKMAEADFFSEEICLTVESK